MEVRGRAPEGVGTGQHGGRGTAPTGGHRRQTGGWRVEIQVTGGRGSQGRSGGRAGGSTGGGEGGGCHDGIQ